MDPVILSRSEILSDEDGKCVSKVLDGQIGKGINFHCCRKGSHDGSAKTVNQTLHCQDSQVHNGLLHTGQSRKTGNFLYPAQTKTDAGLRPYQVRKSDACVEGNSDSGYILRDDGGFSGSADARSSPATNHRSSTMLSTADTARKSQRDHGIAEGAQERGEKIIKENTDQTCKDHHQVLFHQAYEFVRSAQKPDDPVDSCKNQNIQKNCHNTRRTKEAMIPSCSPLSSFCPKRMENTVPLPMASPRMMEVRNVIREKADPTAASASAPRKRPTIRVSAIL